jgi:glucosylceramidase
VVGPASCGQYGPAGRGDDGCDRGALKPEAYGPYAQYFVRFLQAYRAAGVPIYAVTPVNEPGATPDYPGMIMSPQEEGRFVVDYIGPALQRAHLDVKILGYDWNWTDDDPRYAYLGWTLHGGYVPTLLETSGLRRYLDGISWHGYSGDPARMSAIHDTYPDLPQYELEHSSAVDPANLDALRLAIRSTRNWARSVITWNLALDGATGDPGPKIGHGCPGCIGTVSVSDGVATPTPEYGQLGQIAKFVRPGAVRIASTQVAGIEDVAFRNQDGSTVLVAANSGDHATTVSVRVPHRGLVEYQLAAGAAATFTWR